MNNPKARKLVEVAKCLMKTGDWTSAAEYAENNLGWFREVVSACKAAAAASSLADMGTGYRDVIGSYLESLRSRCVFDRLTGEGMIEIPPRTRIISTSAAAIPTSSDTLTPSTNSKVAHRPISHLMLSNNGLDTQSISSICVFSEEALALSGANDLIERELTGAVVAGTDAAFFAYLLDKIGSSILEADTASTPLSDLGRLLDEVLLTGAEKPTLVITPPLARKLATSENADGEQIYFDMTPLGGTLGGVPVLVSDQLPTDSTGDTILLIDATGIVYGSDGLELKTTTAGLIDMTDEPNTDSPQNLVSLFQAGCVGLMAFRHIGWQTIRTTAVAGMTGVNWDGGSTT